MLDRFSLRHAEQIVARALAVPITAALVFGNLLGGRAPVDLGEADASQAGKGFRNKLTAAIYRHIVKTITQKKGRRRQYGGELRHGADPGLHLHFLGQCSQRHRLASFGIVSNRGQLLGCVPHQAAIEIDPRRVIVQLTSNKAEPTKDLGKFGQRAS